MDRIRQRAQSLLEKLHDKYGIEPKHPIHLVLAAAVCRKEGDDPGLQDHWYLVDTHGQKFRLPKTMLFLGREECDVVVALRGTCLVENSRLRLKLVRGKRKTECAVDVINS
ncbi:hypothetical protein ElyMa_000540900 [Elysia marginata]|uniref:Uncharacterized protein n=1 Tax=Elysia marginata TaxID=1093978 RepID=A0AAV4FZG7_9GAST|nr:hypothetical protein ElyMa_000540900 [Elysia marginata]